MAEVILPVALEWAGTTPLVAFAAIDTAVLDQPFWSDALARRNRIVALRPLDTLPEPEGPIPLAGMIHHMGRCGSTLVCRQFGALDRVLAISEPMVFQNLLEEPSLDTARTASRLRRLLHAHTNPLTPHFDRFVIKWSLMLARHARVIADTFALARSIYLHRDPIEVLTAASTSAVTVDSVRNVDPATLHLPPGAPLPSATVGAVEMLARIVAAGCYEVSRTAGIRTLAYTSLPEASVDCLAPYFGLMSDPRQRERMMGAALGHAKMPGDDARFRPDSERKRAGASDAVRHFAQTIVAPALALTLERLDPV